MELQEGCRVQPAWTTASERLDTAKALHPGCRPERQWAGVQDLHLFHRVYTVTPTNGDSHCHTFFTALHVWVGTWRMQRVSACGGGRGETGLQLNVNDKINSELLGECRVHGLEKTEYYIELKIKQLTVPWNFQKIYQ